MIVIAKTRTKFKVSTTAKGIKDRQSIDYKTGEILTFDSKLEKQYYDDIVVVGELIKGIRAIRDRNRLDRSVVDVIALGDGVLDAGVHGLAPALVVNGIGIDDGNGDALGDGGAAQHQHHYSREKNSNLLHVKMLLHICVECVRRAFSAQPLCIPEILREKNMIVNEISDDFNGQ